MPIYWGAVGGAPGGVGIWLIGMALYFMLAGTIEYLSDFGNCSPPTFQEICQNCNDTGGVRTAVTAYNSSNGCQGTGDPGGPPPF